MLTVDRTARTIEGRAVPFNVVGSAPMRLSKRFIPGSLVWYDYPPLVVRWPPLLIEHDQSLRVGRTLTLDHRDDGLWATFRVSRGPKGDRALELAASERCHLSIGTKDEEAVLADDGVWNFVFAQIDEISLTRNPVFS